MLLRLVELGRLLMLSCGIISVITCSFLMVYLQTNLHTICFEQNHHTQKNRLTTNKKAFPYDTNRTSFWFRRGLCRPPWTKNPPPPEGTWDQAARQEVISYIDRMTDTIFWKHYLAQASLAEVTKNAPIKPTIHEFPTFKILMLQGLKTTLINTAP